MSLELTSHDYVEYINRAAEKIASEGEYITELDAATGDGDHWTNINSGFKSLVNIGDELAKMPIGDMFKKIGMTLMSSVGGSSGALYGSAYIAVAKALKDNVTINIVDVQTMYREMFVAIKKRGKVEAGQKTMIDAICPAIEVLKKADEESVPEKETLKLMKNAALDGAQDTKYMEAVRGRAYYQKEKGVGHLDPGAVSMSMLIACFADYCLDKISG